MKKFAVVLGITFAAIAIAAVAVNSQNSSVVIATALLIKTIK